MKGAGGYRPRADYSEMLLGPYPLDEPRLVAWGSRIGASVAVPAVFALHGDLGAGKSVLARAIAVGAGVAAHMPSPTFNLRFEYQGERALVQHLDLYRLNDPSEVWELGWRDLGYDEEIVLIEWPQRAEALLPAPRWDVFLEFAPHDSLLRHVSLRRIGEAPDLPVPQ